jgi:hypothetical protein
MSSSQTGPPDQFFEFSQEAPLKGIIAHLTAKYGGNVHDRGVVELRASSTPSSFWGRHFDPKWVVDFGESYNQFGTNADCNPWLRLDFKERRVIPTHYTIVTGHSDEDFCARFPTSWVVEGSISGLAWAVIDERRHAREIDGPDRTISFQTTNSMSCRYLRIRGTLGNQRGLDMKHFEVFGRLVEPPLEAP